MTRRLTTQRSGILVIATSLLLLGNVGIAVRGQELNSDTLVEFRPPVVPEIEAEPSLYERIDAGFAGAVSYMEQFLFYRLFANHDEYVQFQSEEFYTRPRGSEGPFTRHNPDGRHRIRLPGK